MTKESQKKATAILIELYKTVDIRCQRTGKYITFYECFECKREDKCPTDIRREIFENVMNDLERAGALQKHHIELKVTTTEGKKRSWR